MFSSNTSQVSADQVYIEDVFSTYLYTGNGSSQTITNGIDIAGKGALIWTKCRSDSVLTHRLNDTERGITNRLFSNLTNAQSASATSITATSSTGYTVGSENGFNENTKTFASWTFRKQAKFFDVVTWTGNGANPRAIPHSLASVPGCIIIKRYSDIDDWYVYHRSLATSYYLKLNTTDAQINNTTGKPWNTTPTSTEFYVGGSFGQNITGETYVAYLFAHDTATDGVIQCGSFTGNGSSGQQVTLGWEPQFIILKQTNAADTWRMYDNMRGMGVGGSSVTLQPSASNNESTDNYPYINATGFTTGAITSGTFAYIAIRRGPMKTPTSGTSVFYPSLNRSGVGSGTVFTAGFTSDVVLPFRPSSNKFWTTRMLGDTGYLESNSTATFGGISLINYTDGPSKTFTNAYGGIGEVIFYALARAPGFMDVVCYTGTGSATTFSHNLGVVPELMIVKNRNNAENWGVYSAALGNTKRLRLNSTDAAVTASAEWNNTSPTASVFTVGTDQEVNFSGNTYVAYLFATVAGVSKVGSYTGNGSNQTINCGFSSGARFIMIKRTDSTGDWYAWDSARGIVAGNDPYLFVNSTSAEDTNYDTVDVDSSGFVVNQLSATNINVNNASYIYLAIA